ncbi:PTRH2 [Scenedesmus sp. PABB004]|nr:PTRH2 [Scenedesmus sp. PABB004]
MAAPAPAPAADAAVSGALKFVAGVIVGAVLGALAPGLLGTGGAASAPARRKPAAAPSRPAALPATREELKMVLCVNTRLGMNKGKIAAQCAHAAVGVLQKYRTAAAPALKLWERYGQPKIALKVPDEEAMSALARQAAAAGLPVYVVHDAGRTQIPAGSQTVLAIGPGPPALRQPPPRAADCPAGERRAMQARVAMRSGMSSSLGVSRRPALAARGRSSSLGTTSRRAPLLLARAAAQPLADIALKFPGAGRLATKGWESVSNPKGSKHKQEQQEKQQQTQRAPTEQPEEQPPLEQASAVLEQAAADAQQLGAGAAAVGDAAGALAADADAAAAAASPVPEALAAVRAEVNEYTEEEVAAKGLQERAADVGRWLSTTGTGKGVSIAAGLFLASTLLIAVYRTYQKYSSPRAQRKRVIDKNKLLVEELSKYLPDRRSELSAAVVRKLRGATGFTPVEVFRKYLWYVLRERSFDASAVEDMVLLKAALGLSDDQVAEALAERAQRIYDKYGTLMLNVDGMTPEGVERKATCRALFAKLLYLTEHEPLVAQGSDAFAVTDLRTVFGATDDDVAKLRIVSLYDMDAEQLDALLRGQTGSPPDGDAPGAQQGGGAQAS